MLKSIESQHVPIAEDEVLWFIEDVMGLLHCKEVTVWRYMHRYGLPFVKVGRTSRVLFRREKVKEWVAELEVTCKAVQN